MAAIAALLLAGCGDGPVKDPGVKFDFAAYGDCRKLHDVHKRVVTAMAMTKPKYVLVTGDLIGGGENDATWEMWREITKDLRASAGYHAVKGDHDDARGKGLFEKEFGLERAYYDREFEGGVHVFFLDSTRPGDAEQRTWLEERAGASKARHKIAVMHHTAYSVFANPDNNAESARVQEFIHPTFVKLKFCAVFCGHQHAFYTTLRDGVRYVVTAGGGAHRQKLNESLCQKGDLVRNYFYHFVGCTLRDGGIDARVVDKDGTVVPEFDFPVCRHP